MGYTPTVHAKEARMSTLIVDDELTMAGKNLNVTFIHEGIPGAGTKIINPASTVVFTLAASDEIRASDLSTPYEGSPGTLTKISELEVPMYYKSGTVRVKASAAVSVWNCSGKLQFYVDGIEAGSLHAFGGHLKYVVFSEDIEVTPGALIQVYGMHNNIDGKTFVKDFQICADDVIHNGIKGALW